jgi:NAD(P)H-dependent flavin oxidoreductase YrpB (nitropropane dioxygenase family)
LLEIIDFETTNNNLRKALADKKSAYIDSTMTPYGFYDNGINNNQAKIAEDNKRLPDKSDPYFLTDDQIELLNW